MCLTGKCNQGFSGQINNPKGRYAFKTVVTNASEETILKVEYFNKHRKVNESKTSILSHSSGSKERQKGQKAFLGIT